MIHGIIIAHKDAGRGVLNALKGMYGDIDCLVSLSNEGLSTNELTDAIRAAARTAEGEGVCVFIDAYGGSCWRAAKLARLRNAHVITGFNLPILLSFVTKRAIIPFDELPAVLEMDGKRGIRVEYSCSGE